MSGDRADQAGARLLRHDRLIVVNELRSALSTWTDRLIALALALVALTVLRASLFQRPLAFAAAAVATVAALAGASAARALSRRLQFHAQDGVIAADALADAGRRHYALAAHGLVGGGVTICALVGRPAAAAFAPLGYAVGAGIVHLAPRLALGRGARRQPLPLRHVRRRLHRPVSGALAAIPLVMALLLFRSVEPGPLAAAIGLLSVMAALLLTAVDDDVVRFLSASGYRAGRIVALHGRSLLVFFGVTVVSSVALSGRLAATVVCCVILAALVLLTARVLAYRVHSRRTADTILSIYAAVACLAGVAVPMLLPIVAVAILWQLYRRSVLATWLLT